MRLLLIVVVVAAVTTLLWGTWHMSRKVFHATLAAVLVAAVALVIASLVTDDERRQPAPPDSVSVTIRGVHATETTYRVSAEISNQGKRPVAKVWLRAEALQCPPAKACTVLYQEQKPVPIHIPVDGRYPLAISIHKPSEPIRPDRWRLQVLRVEVYGS